MRAAGSAETKNFLFLSWPRSSGKIESWSLVKDLREASSDQDKESGIGRENRPILTAEEASAEESQQCRSDLPVSYE